MRIDKFDLTIPVVSGTGSVDWSDDVSQWVISAIAITPPTELTTYNMLVKDEANNALVYETGMTGSVYTEVSVETNSVITITIQSASTDGIYTARVYTKK